jgi:hypothetical protein
MGRFESRGERERRKVDFENFVRDLQAFLTPLAPSVERRFEWEEGELLFEVQPPTERHRSLAISGNASGIEFQLGEVWGEFDFPDQVALTALLAACDAVRDGRVRECRDRSTGLIYHVYRLRSRGLDQFQRDSQYSFRHARRIKRVDIHRLPPLVTVAA